MQVVDISIIINNDHHREISLTNHTALFASQVRLEKFSTATELETWVKALGSAVSNHTLNLAVLFFTEPVSAIIGGVGFSGPHLKLRVTGPTH